MTNTNRAALMGALLGVATPGLAGTGALARPPVNGETVRSVVATLASDELAGRDNDTDGGRQARAWLVEWLTAHGVVPAGDGGGYEQAIAAGANLVGVLPDAQGRVEGPVALLAAHYDGLGTNCRHRAEARTPVCHGATDNAGGVAAVLGAVEALRGHTSAPIAVVLWDREEDGLVGSAHFVAQPSPWRASLKLLVNLDIIGLDLFDGLESNHFLIGSETGGAALTADARAVAGAAGLDGQIFTYAFGHRRSDMTSFVTAGWTLPFVFLSDGDGSVYHTDADDLEHADLAKVTRVGEVVAGLAEAALAHGDAYVWAAPTAVGGNYLPTHADGAALSGLLARVRGLSDRNALGDEQRASLEQAQQSLDAAVGAGAGAWGPAQALEAARTTQLVVGISRARAL
jgi:hypothetical protein